jgi:hypothetical protein
MKDKNLDTQFAYLKSRLTVGRLLDPSELLNEFASMRDAGNANNYAISAQISEALANRLESRLVPQALRFTVIPTPGRLMVSVATVQSGGLQLRFVVPLIEEKAIAWIEHSVAKQQLTFALDIAKQCQSLLLGASTDFPDADTLRRLVRSSPKLEDEEVMHELGNITVELLNNDAISSCLPHFDVTDVHIIVASELLFDEPKRMRSMAEVITVH